MAARRRPLPPATIIRRNALFLGVLGNSPLWRTVAVVVFGRRLVKRLVGKQPELVAEETLHPGQWVRITALPQDTARQRKRFRRTAPGRAPS